MRHIFAAIFFLAISLMPMTAPASDYEDMDVCLGKAVVARAICKSPAEVYFVARVKKDVYLFSAFYARQEARFLVGVGEKTVRVQGKEFLKLTKTLPYHFDKQSKCGVLEFSGPDCPDSEPIVCCSEKTIEDKLDDKFWSRPIPDLLDEDLRRALEEYERDADTEEGAGEGADGEAAPEQ